MVARPVLAAAAQQLSVVVASKNAVKIRAVAAALRLALPGVRHEVKGAESSSGVPDQPWGDAETLAGAHNRVASIAPQHRGSLLVAIEGGVGPAAPLPPPAPGLLSAGQLGQPGLAGQEQQQQQPQPQQPQPAVAHERRPRHGSSSASSAAHQPHQPQQQQQQQLECFAWVVVQSPCGATSHARSASFPLPPAVADLVLNHGMELGHADDAVFGRVKSGQGSGTIGKLTGSLLTRQAYYEHAALCALVPLMNPSLYPGFDLAQLPALAGRDDAAAASAD